jgi:YegS/Rv2252/BmrU family lipid kinase
VPTPFHKAWIVANPVAGRGRARHTAHDLSLALLRTGVANELRFTGAKGDARKILGELDPSVDLVVAIGGDGTVNEVLEGLGTRRVPVAILPMGTANVLGLDLALPRDVDGALAMIAEGRTNALDTASVNRTNLSFLVVGIGFDAMVVRELDARRKGPITKASWLVPALTVWRKYRAPVLTVEADGARIDGTFGWVLVSNVVHYAGFAVLSSDLAIDDGLLEVYLFEGGSRAALVGYALRGLTSGFPGGSCRRIRARRITVTSTEPVPIQIDGEARGTTPVDLEINAVPHTLVVPAAWANRNARGATRANSAR